MKIHTRSSILLAFIFVLVVVSILGTLISNYQVQKNRILNSTHTEINATLQYYFERQKTELTNLLSNHAYWSDVSSHLKVNDQKWIHENVTQYLSFNKQYGIDLLYLSSEPYHYEEYYGIIPKETILKLPVTQAILNGQLMASDFVVINQNVYLVAAAAITQNDYSHPEGVLIFARHMDNSVLQSISQLLSKRSITKISYIFTSTPFSYEESTLQDRTLTVNYPLVDKKSSDQFAYLSIEISANQIDEIMQSTLSRVISATIIVLLFGLLAVYMMFFHISKNISKSVSQIEYITQGNYDVKLNLGGAHEFIQLSQCINQLSSEIEDHMTLLEQHYLDVVGMMAKSIEVSDHYTNGHSERVSYYAVELARALQYTDIESIRISGLLHDIGKIAIDSAILNKPSKLNEDEFESIKKHPEIGYSILEKSTVFDSVKEIVLYHHEHYDGSGYPNGLFGEQIPIGSRILCIADAFDAMTSDRSYRQAIPVFRAIEIMRTTSGIQFDPEMVRVFLDLAETLYHKWHQQS